MADLITGIFLAKAEESLAGAESEFANGRYNNCANRCYYSCFQAAVAALLQAGIVPAGRSTQWGHTFVQAQFAGELINRRKLYPADLRAVLMDTHSFREKADYRNNTVTQREAPRSLQWTRNFLESVQVRG